MNMIWHGWAMVVATINKLLHSSGICSSHQPHQNTLITLLDNLPTLRMNAGNGSKQKKGNQSNNFFVIYLYTRQQNDILLKTVGVSSVLANDSDTAC